MERYELLGLVGEGSYGTVMKCRHRDSSRLVAIKKFVDPDDDKTVKKIALREIKLLRQLRHDNLVNLLEVWRHRRHWYLVFEFVDRTLLDELEKNPNGLDLNTSRLYLFQILRAAAFCHQQHVIHRDIKPENILLSQGDVLKLCDFGFARTVTSPTEEGAYTDYVATRWYRAPELLVGDTKYGRPVDVWAVGCLTMEMLTGQPLFPGDSDLDQIYQIIRCVGNLTAHHQELFHSNPVFSGVSLPECSGRVPLEQRFSTIPLDALGLAQSCLQMDPEKRSECSELLEDPLFTQDSFHIRVLEELNAKIQKDHRENATLPKIAKTPRPEVNEGDVKIQKAKDKKQSRDMEGQMNKEQDKRSKNREKEKIQKVNPSNPRKIIGTTSENAFPARLSKGLGSKSVDNTAKATTAVSKAGKAIHTELREGAEYFKLTKTRTTDSLETFKTHLKDNNPMSALSKCAKVVSPQTVECHSKHKDTKDRDATGLDSSVMEVTPLSKSDPSQDLGRSFNTLNPKESKVFKRLTSDFPNPGSPSKIHLKQNTKPSDAKPTEETGENFPKEHSQGSPVTHKLKRVQTEATLSRGTCDVCVNVTKPTIPSVAKLAKTTKKALPLNLKPSKATSNSGPTRTKNNTASGGSAQPSCSSDSTTTLPIESPQTYSSKATKDTTHVSHKPPEDLPKDEEHTEASKHQQDSWIPSNISDLHRCLKMSPLTTTAANHSETSHVMRDYKQYSQLCSTHQQTTKQYRRTSTSTPSQTSKSNMTSGTKIPNTLEVLVEENRTDFFESISPPTISFSDQTYKSCRSSDVELKSKTIEAGPNIKSSVESKFEPLSHFSESVTTQKTRTSADDQNNKSSPEMRNKATTSLTSTAVRENQAAMERSTRNNLGFSSSYCALHPAPLSSTHTISTLSVIIANIPSTSGHLTQESDLYPESQNIRCDDRPMLCGVNYCPTVKRPPLGHITGQLTPQSVHVAGRSPIGKCSCSIGITADGKKSDLQDRRGPTLPELRGQEGKITRGTSLDQKKCKQLDLPLEPQHNGRNSVDST